MNTILEMIWLNVAFNFKFFRKTLTYGCKPYPNICTTKSVDNWPYIPVITREFVTFEQVK